MSNPAGGLLLAQVTKEPQSGFFLHLSRPLSFRSLNFSYTILEVLLLLINMPILAVIVREAADLARKNHAKA